MLHKLLIILFLTFAFLGSGQSNNNCQTFEKLNSYQVIGFGEASHGSYSDYVARTELINCLLKKGDSICVLIEMPQAAGITIEKYFSGEIDEDSLVNEVKYYGLKTNAFLDFIKQFKGNEQVSFHGIDMQLHQSTLVYLKEAIHQLKPTIELSQVFDSLNHHFLYDFTDSMYQDFLPVIKRNVDLLKKTITSEGLLVPENFLSIQYPLQIVEQHFHLLAYAKPLQNFNYVSYRDSCMAKNAISIIDFFKQQTLVLGAISHIMSSNKSEFPMMGGHLKNEYGKEYFVIASQYLKGAILAVDNINGQRTIWQKEFESHKKSIPCLIEKLLKPQSDTLIFVTTSHHQLHKYFSKKQLGYSMGTSSGFHLKKQGLVFFKPGEFDAIYYIPNVIPSKSSAK